MRRVGRALRLAGAALLLGGCASVADGADSAWRPGYLWQSVRGHLGMLQAARPVDAVLADPATGPALRQRFPDLNLQLFEEKSAVLIARLEQGSLDAAFLALPLADDRLHSEALFSEPFLVAVPPGHALADKGSATLEDLRQQTLMLLEEGHCLREQALEVCELSGARETMEFRATSLETLRQMVIAGMGVTLLPILATAGLGAGAGGMRLLPFAGSTPNRRIGLVWRQTSPMAGLLRQIAELCRDIAGTQRQLGLTRL